MARDKMTISGQDVQTISAHEVGTVEDNLPGIIDPKTFSVPAIENPYADDFASFTTGLFLPRLQLEGSSSKLVKNRKVPAGNYIIITGKDAFEILGEKIDILVLTYRSKALDICDTKNIVASFDKNSEEFRRIQAAAQQKSKGYMYGLDFLCYIPDSKGETKYASLFMGNPTFRMAARNFKPLIGKAVTMGVELINNTEYTWEAPTIVPCTTALSNYPSKEEMEAQMKDFVNPPKGPVVERIGDEEAAAAGTDRDR